MKQRNTPLFLSLGILFITTIIVSILGVVPFPEYEILKNEEGLKGKLIYHVQVQSQNLIPPAPDIMDQCILSIDFEANPFKEETTIDFGRVVDEVEIKLFDVLGKLLNDYYLQNIDKFVLFREEKVNGIYFIEVEIKGEKESIYKLVIED